MANPPKLIEDLEEDQFIHYLLTGACCELYYRYGMYLAPFTAMLTTARHINFNKNKKSLHRKHRESGVKMCKEPQSEE